MFEHFSLTSLYSTLTIRFIITFISVTTLIMCICYCESQRLRAKSRSRGRNRGDNQCHLKEVDSCLDKVQALTKSPNPTILITTSEGLDKICG